MSDAQSYRRPLPKEKAPGALELLDEAFHRLRAAPLAVLGLYYAGSLPFALALLYFWGDLSHSADATRYRTGAALGLAVLFLWMKTCHALFARRLRDVFNHREGVRLGPRGLLNLFLVQSTVHSLCMFPLLVASILTVPFGWAYAICQSVTAIGAGDEGTAREVWRRAFRAGVLWPKQNHVMLLVFSLLGLFVWLNLAGTVFLIPQLLKIFTGEDNAFTRGGMDIFNSTTLTVTLSLAWLVLDPVVKTFYALRCFYVESQHSGEDLKSELRALPPVRASVTGSSIPDTTPAAAATAGTRRSVPAPAAVAAVTLVLACIFAGCLPPSSAHAALPPAPPPPAAGKTGPAGGQENIQPPALDKSIEEVMRRREFAWRLPPAPDAAPPEDSTFDSITGWLKDVQKWVGTQIGNAVDALRHRWRKLFPDRKEPDPDPVEGAGGSHFIGPLMQLLIYALITILACGLLYYAWRTWGRRRAPELAGHAAATGTLAEPDLADDAVVASQLPEDEWLQLSRRLLAAGENRLALRALYLSVLALLGTRELLVIARHKSNRDYQAELRRRARDRAELQLAFTRNVGRYERVWYGPHPATAALFDQFMTDRQVISDAAAAGSLPAPPLPA